MYYIVQENVFREDNYNNLIIALNRLKLSYEIVKIMPFIETIKFKTKRKDIFPFGSLKMSKISNQYNWKPGSQMNDNHDFFPMWLGKKHKEETKKKIGIANSKSQKGERNSQYGTMWITNGKENRKIRKEDIIPKGWNKGRKVKR